METSRARYVRQQSLSAFLVAAPQITLGTTKLGVQTTANAAGRLPVALRGVHVIVSVAAYWLRARVQAHGFPLRSVTSLVSGESVRDLVPDSVLNFCTVVEKRQFPAECDSTFCRSEKLNRTPSACAMQARTETALAVIKLKKPAGC